MLLKISWKSENVVHEGNGTVTVKVPFYGPYAHGCHLVTTKGSTQEDFDKGKGLANKTVFVGTRGGISLE